MKNTLERLLEDDLNRLIDRMAVTAREGLLAGCAERRPDLSSRLDDLDTRLSDLRAALLHGYEIWRGALDECDALWALIALADETPAALERRAA